MPVSPPQVAKARIYPVLNPVAGSVSVHFNPTSLVYSVENSTPQQAGDPKKRQYAAQFTAKLTMDLQFDTTDSGADVRDTTRALASFLAPPNIPNQSSAFGTDVPAVNNSTTPSPAQPVICFEWGTYSFQGVMENFRETIDFFSPEGVPLRALVSLGLARQDQVFDDSASKSTSNGTVTVPSSPTGGVSRMLDQLGGDPSAARQVGASNGLDSLRFTTGASLQIQSGPQLNPASGFAPSVSAGSGLGLSLGVGSAVSAGAGSGVGGLGAAFGSGSSAGVPATSGAFAGLESGRTATTSSPQINMSTFYGSPSGSDVSTSNGASYSLGGAANSSSGAGASANVGVSFSFRDRLTFDNDD